MFRLIGGAIGVAGLGLAIAFLLADRLGFGEAPGVGWGQILGTVLGVLTAATGAAIARRPPRFTSLRDLLERLALAAGSLLVSLLLAEACFRLIRPPSVEVNHQPPVYQPDPVVGYRYIPGSHGYIERLEYRVPIRINSAGFFDDEHPLTPPPDATRIAVIGDSFTVGFQVGRGSNFPDVLESQLNQSGAEACPCEVLNFGLDGTGTVQQADILEHTVLAYQPDIVLVALHAASDLNDVRVATVQRDVYRGYVLAYHDEAEREALTRKVDDLLSGGGGALRFGIQRSYLVRALYNAWFQDDRLPRPNVRDNRARIKPEIRLTSNEARVQVIESIERMQHACRAAGCEIVVVAIPDKTEVLEGAAPLEAPITEALTARRVRTLSLLEAFGQHADQGETLYWELDGHCNEVGYHLIGVEIAAYLQREGLLSGS